MASVEDYPFADFKYGSFDMSSLGLPATNTASFGYPTNPELASLGLFDGMEQMNTNMAYLEEESVPVQNPIALGAPSLIVPHYEQPQQIHNHHTQQHQPQQHQPQQHQPQQHNQHHFPALEMDLFPQQQFDGFPPVHAFVPAVSTPVQHTVPLEFATPQRSRQLSEPDLLETLHTSPLSLSPGSVSYSTAPSSTADSSAGALRRYKVTRGISSGGSATKPPRVVTLAHHHYAPVNLELVGATLHDLCLPQWSEAEKMDRRRIIRVERFQVGARIVAQFSIVGSALEHPKTKPAAPGVDVVEVSCLECYTSAGDDEEDELTSQYGYKEESELKRSFYITSVEVIKVVELLIGTEVQDAVERRRERGRIRSNLVPFWSKKPISSRMSNQEARSSPLGSDSMDFRVELATRIMSYEIRKPRGFDKEVRILKWEKLVPALKRALQSYYVEVPDNFEEDDE